MPPAKLPDVVRYWACIRYHASVYGTMLMTPKDVCIKSEAGQAVGAPTKSLLIRL